MTDTGSRGDQRNIQYLRVSDFSPGIYDNSVIAFGSPPNTVPGIFPAPPGAADATATFGCISQANGGLGPLPALGGAPGSTGLSLSDMGGSSVVEVDITALVNSFQSGYDELVLGTTALPSGGSQSTVFRSYAVGAAATNSITSVTSTYTAAKNYCAFPFTTIINHSGTLQPVVVLPLTCPDGPTSALMNYPAVASPTAFGVDTIATTTIGTAFGHQGRIVTQQVNVAGGWPINQLLYTPNEAFSYTDPPQSQTWPHQFEIFGPENPVGYGAVNSVSAGELFCIKKHGGAIIIQGDLNNPTVTTLPGVKSTGLFYGRTDTGQNGIYYCSANEGAWVWNGGNTSQKISHQLDDHFFQVANPISACTYYGYYCQRWEDWMLFSNNWIFSETSGGWWRMQDPSVRSFYWMVPSIASQFMYYALPTVVNASEKFLFEYDRTIPRSSFTWQSLPMRFPSDAHTSSVRELVIRASNPYGDAAPQIVATLIDDKGNSSLLDTWTMTPGTDMIQEIRLNCGTKQTTTVAVNLACSGTLYAPVVAEFALGYRTREHVALA